MTAVEKEEIKCFWAIIKMYIHADAKTVVL